MYDVGSSHPGAGENKPSLLGGNAKVIKRTQNGESLLKFIKTLSAQWYDKEKLCRSTPWESIILKKCKLRILFEN